MFAGRPVRSAYGVYVSQGSVFFTTGAPNFLAWFGAPALRVGHAALWLTMAVLLMGMATAIMVSEGRIDNDGVLILATLMLLAIPFLLPTMRGRYFFPGEVLLLVWILRNRGRHCWLLILIQVPLLFDYIWNLFRRAFPLGGAPGAAMLIAAGLLVLISDARHVLTDSRPTRTDAMTEAR